MPLVTPTPITALDGIIPPSTGSPADFDPRADEFLGAFPALQEQINTTATQTNTNAAFARDKAVEAEASALAAEASEISAQASAISASSAGNATKWTPAGVFAEGECAWSPVDYRTYRKITPGSGTTGEPSNTYATWRDISSVNHIFNLSMGII